MLQNMKKPHNKRHKKAVELPEFMRFKHFATKQTGVNETNHRYFETGWAGVSETGAVSWLFQRFRLPRINNIDLRNLERAGIAGGNAKAVATGNGCNLGIGHADRQTVALCA